MIKQLTVDDLDALALGSAVLGSGGGGDSSYAKPMAQYHLEQYGPAKVITHSDLTENDLVVPLSLMGAPLINIERILSGRELNQILETITTRLGKKPTALMAAEIGGANAFTPLMIASKWNLPILDADMIGRAFPELQMSTCYLNDLNPSPAVVVDCLGNVTTIEAKDPNKLENIARSVTVSMGSSSSIAFYLMNGTEAKRGTIPGTLSQALQIGHAILRAREEGNDPVIAIQKESEGSLIARGTLVDIDQAVHEGFLKGSLTLLSEDNTKVAIEYQNEFLMASIGEQVVASTPDLIVLLDETSGTPIMSETLRYGLQVALVAIPAPKVWTTPEGLAIVGPEVFGYETSYIPLTQTIS